MRTINLDNAVLVLGSVITVSTMFFILKISTVSTAVILKAIQ